MARCTRDSLKGGLHEAFNGNHRIIMEDMVDSFHNILDDVQWEDLMFPVTQAKRGSSDLPHFDYDEIGLLFPQNDATEKIFIVNQMKHEWKLESNIRPHIHFIQSSSAIPVFKLDYRWYKNGDPVPETYTTIATESFAFEYESGSILQIARFPEISGEGIDKVSYIIDIKI